MSDFPWLTTLAALPFAGGVLVALTPGTKRKLAKNIALLFALLELALAVVVIVKYNKSSEQKYQLTESYAWIENFGVHWSLGVDGIGVVLILLTAALMPLLILASWNDADEPEDSQASPRKTHAFFALTLMVESMVIVSFAATDIFLFYIFFEAMLIPMYFLIGGYGPSQAEGEKQRSYAAVKFLLYNLLGGLVMLASVVALYVVTANDGIGTDGRGTFDLAVVTRAVADGSLTMSSTTQNLIFLGFLFAFAVKAPLFPFHTWLPDAMTESTPGTAVLITAVVDKVGTFAMLRFCLELFPDASKTFAPVIITLAVIGIIYGALLAVGQTDIKRLIAYTSISHFGFIILGIFVMTSQGQTGATLYMVNHGFSTAALLLIAGFLISRRGSKMIADFGGVQKVAPVLAGTFLVAGLATLSMPGLAPFVSEFLVLVGAYAKYKVAALFATVGIVLAALYVLVLYQRTMTGPVKPGNEKLPDLNLRELVVVGPLIALLLVLGVYPKPVVDIIDPSVDRTLVQVDVEKPAPAHPVTEAQGVHK